MSSVASTSSTAAVRPPNKRVRYLTDDSSYSSFSATGTIRREAEEQAARELAAERQASRQRVLSVWESLEERYSRALDDDDIVDLESLTLVQDTGTLKEIANVPFGSLAAQDDVLSENDEDDDELGDWDDERYSAQHAWNRLKTGGARPPRTEEDDQDLREFLRAESARKREEGLSDEQDDDSHTSRDQGEDEERTEGDYVTEEEEEEGGEEEEEEESVSSFRPTPSQGRETNSASGTGSEESEDELAGPNPYKSNKVDSLLSGGAEALQEEVTNSAQSTSSSEDEIAASDVEKERLYRERLRTEEPMGRGRFSSVRPDDSPKASKVIRSIGNPQLSTPPRSKSFSTPSDIFYQNPSPRQKTHAVRSHTPKVVLKPAVARRSSVMPPSKKRNPAPPLPEVALGKRKRRPSPLPTPSSKAFTPSHGMLQRNVTSGPIYPHHKRTISHARTYSSSGFTEPPVSIDEYDQKDYESPDEVDTLSRHSLSPVPYRTRTAEPSHRQVPNQRREESLAPSDLSQLVFHLKKVNEWVQTHHVDELPFAEGLPLPSLPLERSPSKRPTWPRSIPDSISEDGGWSMQFTPPNRNRIMSVRGSGSSARSSRTYSSLMGPPPTPARLFESGSTNSSAQNTPNKFLPMKSSPFKASPASSSRVSGTSRSSSSIRAASSQPSRRQRHRPPFEGADTDDRYDSSIRSLPRTQAAPPTKRAWPMISPTRARSSKPTSVSGPSRHVSSTGSRRY